MGELFLSLSARQAARRALLSTIFCLLFVAGIGLNGASANSNPLLLAQVEIKPDTPTIKKDDNSTSSDEEEVYPQVMRELEKLPFPVRRMRELILEAALSGDIEKLRPLIGAGDDLTMLSLGGGVDTDPLTYLRAQSGDREGHEILAILSEVLEAGFVLMNEGTENELYVWPYFFAWPLDKLSPEQKVELYRLVTYGDYEEMESFGAYIFYRLGITPRGRWRFFVSGD